jgi:tRNA(fMet)-specific endonuclease VapC
LAVIVADTDVLIDFLRGKGLSDKIASELKTGKLATTAVSAFELWAGCRTAKQIQTVEILLSALTILSLTEHSAKRSGVVKRELEVEGITIGMADSLIAGITIENQGVLLTRNIKHFDRIKGLLLSPTSKD